MGPDPDSDPGSLVVVVARQNELANVTFTLEESGPFDLNSEEVLGANAGVTVAAAVGTLPTGLELTDAGRDYAEWTVTLQLASPDDAAKLEGLQDLALILKYRQGAALS